MSDFLNALSLGTQARLNREQVDQLDRRKTLGPEVQAAIGGDSGALGRIAAVDADYAVKLGPILESMDAKQRAKATAGAQYTYQGANAVLQADPAERPAIYKQVLAQGTAMGLDLKHLPQDYTPQMEGQLRTWRQMAIPVLEQWKVEQDKPQPMPGGGAAPAGSVPAGVPGGGGGSQPNPNNVGNVRPNGQSVGFQQPASIEDGVRLAVNNAKAYPAAFNNGQPMTIAQIAQRWAPKGDGNNDPAAWARNVATIGGLDPNQPIDLNDPATAAKFARGVHGAEWGGQAAKPFEFYQGVLSGTPLNGGIAPPDVVKATSDPRAQLRGIQLPPGAAIMAHKGIPIVKDGTVLVRLQDGSSDFVPLPQRKEPGAQPPAGPFAGNAIEAQYANILIQGNPASPEYAQAYAHFAAPRTTVNENSQMVTIQPDVSHLRKPTYRPSDAAPGAVPAGGPTPAPGAPAVQPGGQTVTVQPGRGHPIPASESEKIASGVTLINKIDKALDIYSKKEGAPAPSSRAAGFLARNAGQTGDMLAQEFDPAGVDARAILADVNSQIMLARSGAAVTEGEAKRLIAMLPAASDKPEVIRKKLAEVRTTYADMLRNQTSQYTKENGFIPHEGASRVLSASPQAAAPNPGGDLKKKYGLE